ncbi:hypothetical protein PHYBLDRAFT_164707 [Phycomyces blakesleeanus NRRL 1555(-)]|uniref:Uncharacterized protein n=1 Tax=Phycomyces blakesleeanus (strain ATCC 8743b / DSM 1359 / FGSC 10004 / NBRC 33097 / NRRL 1555) TaxID=763407 RepID=A0A167PFQ9_PHYB8|nr:hypothetical protein PHYBLDRAFT_164707 [Phycomyces blakesleeanus NRRL 1555(-)]OAD77819.1 hypothetical protein PHYBLDRAFT_164707 [Phycomyces blakesleeanus NRRL 1555(-)]|eukprot:XP_018295859.1 hypothetical protein PHYBLDRAFT_164707 [Phycomyces blakesleeanus NRRL 1555(-)]
MSKPVHIKNEILRSDTGLIINPYKACPHSETRHKQDFTGKVKQSITGFHPGLQGLSHPDQVITNRSPSRATVFSDQVKHQVTYLHPGLQVYKNSMNIQSRSFMFSKHLYHPGQGSRIQSKSMVSVSIPSRSSFKDPDSVRGYRTMTKSTSIMEVCLRSGYTMKILVSIQCNMYIHLVGPLLTVGFIFLLSLPSKPVIKDPISVQCYRYTLLFGFLSIVNFNFFVFLPSEPVIEDLISAKNNSVFTIQVNYYGSNLCLVLQAVILIQGNSYAILLKSLPIMAYNSLVCFTVQMNYQAYGISPVLKWFYHRGQRLRIRPQSISLLCMLNNKNPLSPSKVIVKANRSRFTVLQAQANDQSFDILLGSQSTRRKGQQSRYDSPSWMLVHADYQSSAIRRANVIYQAFLESWSTIKILLLIQRLKYISVFKYYFTADCIYLVFFYSIPALTVPFSIKIYRHTGSFIEIRSYYQLSFSSLAQFIPTIRLPISIQGYKHTSLLHHLLAACFICPEFSQPMSTIMALTHISSHSHRDTSLVEHLPTSSCIFPYFLQKRQAIRVSLSIKVLGQGFQSRFCYSSRVKALSQSRAMIGVPHFIDDHSPLISRSKNYLCSTSWTCQGSLFNSYSWGTVKSNAKNLSLYQGLQTSPKIKISGSSIIYLHMHLFQ